MPAGRIAADHQRRREQSDQHVGGAEHDALPFRFGQRACEIARENMPRRDESSRNNSVTRWISRP